MAINGRPKSQGKEPLFEKYLKEFYRAQSLIVNNDKEKVVKRNKLPKKSTLENHSQNE